MENTLIIKLGGSAFSKTPNMLFDFDYLKALRTFLQVEIEKGKKFLIVVGGGQLARLLIDSARAGGITEEIQLHMIGRTSCIMNAEVVRAFFSEFADPNLIKYDDFTTDTALQMDYPIIVAGAGKPGTSSDMGAAILAVRTGAKRIISLKNVDGIYSADPRYNPDVVRLPQLTWQEYQQIIGGKKEHEPRGSYPVDPVSAEFSKQNGLEFAIVSAENLHNLQATLAGEKFEGSLIS